MHSLIQSLANLPFWYIYFMQIFGTVGLSVNVSFAYFEAVQRPARRRALAIYTGVAIVWAAVIIFTGCRLIVIHH